jgi:hypothetical protein
MDILGHRSEPFVEFVIRRGELAEELGGAPGPVENDDRGLAAIRVLLQPGRARYEPMRSFISSNSALRAPLISAAQDLQVSSPA